MAMRNDLPEQTKWEEIPTQGEMFPKASDMQVGGDHYKDLPIQPSLFAWKNELRGLEYNVVKRVCRHRRGGKGVEDIDKAIHELQLIKEWEYGDQEG